MNLIITKELIANSPRTEGIILMALNPALPRGVKAEVRFNELWLSNSEVEFMYEIPEELTTWLIAFTEGEEVEPINWEVPCCPDDLPLLEAI